MSANRSELERRVAAHPFLIGLSPHHIALLTDSAMLTHFDTGELIFRSGETANRFYLIESGSVALESNIEGRERVAIDHVTAGDLLGWSWLFPPYIWHFDARAVEPTLAIFFYGTVLREYCEKDPALGFELFKRMSVVMIRRLQSARTKLLEAMRREEMMSRSATVDHLRQIRSRLRVAFSGRQNLLSLLEIAMERLLQL